MINLTDSSAVVPFTNVTTEPVVPSISALDTLTRSASDDSTQIQALISAAKDWRLRGREYRIALGRVLRELHTLLCKPGCGSFTRTVTEQIGMPYTTARDYMEEADIADGHYDIRKDVAPDMDVVEFEPNDGSLDATDLAIMSAAARSEQAFTRAADPTLLRDFHWKFRLVSKADYEALHQAKKKLTPDDVIGLLSLAATIPTTNLSNIISAIAQTTATEVTYEALAA